MKNLTKNKSFTPYIQKSLDFRSGVNVIRGKNKEIPRSLGRGYTGFTLIELLVYIAVLVIIVTAISSFIIWVINSNSKTKVIREVLNNSRRAVDIITAEIKEAKEIYTPTTVFNSHPGQLSLKTLKYLPANEAITYIDFYICEDRLCFKKESQEPVVLTSDKVKVTNLVFSQIAANPPSIQIDLRVEYANVSGRPELQAVSETRAVASLRSY